MYVPKNVPIKPLNKTSKIPPPPPPIQGEKVNEPPLF